MLERKEYKGMWFLPENPELNVAGTLYYSPNEEIRLELIGSFYDVDMENIFGEKNSNIKTIHGIIYGEKKLEKISLFNCYISKRYFFSSNFPLTKYICHLMLIGKHVLDLNEQLFDKARVKFPCLMDWYSYRPLGFEIQFDEQGKTAKQFQWKITMKDERFRKTFAIDDNTNLILDAVCGFQQMNNYNFELNENAHIEIETLKKESFEKFYSLSILFKDFLSFTVLTEIPFSEIVLYDYNDFQEYENGEKNYHTTSVYFITPKISSSQCWIVNFLFKYRDIESDFSDIIKIWYNEKDKLAPIRTRLIDSLTYKKDFSSIDFLIVIQSLQGFYYRYINKSNKISLREQLEDLYDKFQDISFVKNNTIDYNKVRDSRHYYSHFFGEDEKEDICSGRELYEITQKLKLLLICSILSLLGFDNKRIDNCLRSSNKLVWAYRK